MSRKRKVRMIVLLSSCLLFLMFSSPPAWVPAAKLRREPLLRLTLNSEPWNLLHMRPLLQCSSPFALPCRVCFHGLRLYPFSYLAPLLRACATSAQEFPFPSVKDCIPLFGFRFHYLTITHSPSFWLPRSAYSLLLKGSQTVVIIYTQDTFYFDLSLQPLSGVPDDTWSCLWLPFPLSVFSAPEGWREHP